MSLTSRPQRRSTVFVCCISLLSVLNSNVAAIAVDTASTRLVLPINDTPSTSSADLIWPLNSTTPFSTLPPLNSTTLKTSTVGAPKIACNGALYGRNLNLASCEQVYSIMSSNTIKRSFGQRHEGDWDVNLPFRWMSQDGRCAIDLGHRKDVLGDEAKPSDIKAVVRVLLDVCVKVRPNEGGIASNVGDNGNLLLRIVPYKPTVTCGDEGSGPPGPTCRDVIDYMITDGKVTFGPKGDPETTVPLPWAVTRGRRRCLLAIDATEAGPVKDTWDWYNMWMAANAVDYMCIQRGKQGVATNLGQQKRLNLLIKDVNQPGVTAHVRRADLKLSPRS